MRVVGKDQIEVGISAILVSRYILSFQRPIYFSKFDENFPTTHTVRIPQATVVPTIEWEIIPI